MSDGIWESGREWEEQISAFLSDFFPSFEGWFTIHKCLALHSKGEELERKRVDVGVIVQELNNAKHLNNEQANEMSKRYRKIKLNERQTFFCFQFLTLFRFIHTHSLLLCRSRLITEKYISMFSCYFDKFPAVCFSSPIFHRWTFVYAIKAKLFAVFISTGKEEPSLKCIISRGCGFVCKLCTTFFIFLFFCKRAKVQNLILEPLHLDAKRLSGKMRVLASNI